MKRISAKRIFPITSKPIENGYVDIDEDGTILNFGPLPDCEKPVFNGFLIPGFVNSHCHIELSYLKDMFAEATGMDGFIKQINSMRSTVEYSKRIESIQREMDNLYMQGVSAMADISNCNESFAIKARSAIYTRTFLEVFGTEPEDVDKIISEAYSLQKCAEEYGLDAAPSPHSCYTMSQELNRAASFEGLKSGYISYHSQESRQENDMIRYGTGELAEDYNNRGTTKLPIMGISSLQYFIRNLSKVKDFPIDEHIILVHNVDTDEESIEEAKKSFSHSYWALCPMSNIFIHRTLPNIPLLKSHNLKICVGTDSLSSNHSLSMIDEIKCILSHFGDTISLEDVLEWSCINGAEAIGKENTLGSIEINKHPGLVLLENVDFANVRLTDETVSRRII